MALIGTETFCLSKFWAYRTIELLKSQRDLFSKENMRRIRVELIAGKNMLKSIKNWLIAAQLIECLDKDSCILSDSAKTITDEDGKLDSSATWWAIHLGICFSERSEPYAAFFRNMDVSSRGWIRYKDLPKKIQSHPDFKEYTEKSLESNLDGVKKMFYPEGPLKDLALIEIRKRKEGEEFRIDKPEISDEMIIYALSLARCHKFQGRSSIDFSELLELGFNNFLCLSVSELRERLKRMSDSSLWENYLSFTEAVNLYSISFGEGLHRKTALIQLLKNNNDTWI